MSDRSIANSLPSFSPTVATSPAAARPVAARTKLLLEGPVLSTLLRLAAPNVLNLLAIAGMITFDGLFLGHGGISHHPDEHVELADVDAAARVLLRLIENFTPGGSALGPPPEPSVPQRGAT